MIRFSVWVLVWISVSLSACGSCQKNGAADGDASVTSARVEAGPSPDEDLLWANAASGDPDDLARLADREGAAELARAGSETQDLAKKLTAIKALAFADGFSGLPFLASEADGADATRASAAVESIDALAGQPRRAVDPEDATEFRAGCTQLLHTAKNTAKTRAIRVGIVRALRVWQDRGCAAAEEIPIDVDVK
ncbi:MAG: hypothetical protein ACRELY_11175 [Polyangiaceae bacterium]